MGGGKRRKGVVVPRVESREWCLYGVFVDQSRCMNPT
jgi:hypothetical protein